MTSGARGLAEAPNTAYRLSKRGKRMLTRTAGVQLAQHGILVVDVGPGALATPPINAATIAGRAGITPFINWIRSLDDTFYRDVAFYYSINHESEAIYLDEIHAAATNHTTLHTHIVNSSRDGLLTADTAVGDMPDQTALWVYMCGPPTR
jgi:NAD(P)-dependent dehydrogenase (short-subunit alcohol dehydrogenase family)